MNDSKIKPAAGAGIQDNLQPPGATPSRAELQPLTDAQTSALATRGYAEFSPLLPPSLANSIPGEVDQLAAEGYFAKPADRLVNGLQTEILLSIGPVIGNGPGSPVYRRSAVIRELSSALQALGRQFNSVRAALLASGQVSPNEAPELAVEGMEWNINRVQPPWTGLHPHQDQHRFTPGAMRQSVKTIAHSLQRARVLTVSGYARPLTADGTRLEDLGGALAMFVRRGARGPEDKAIFDVVPAQHNTGAMFFAHTLHGVARMITSGSVRYSFQAFFPAKAAWDAIAERIAAGELEREREVAAKANASTLPSLI